MIRAGLAPPARSALAWSGIALWLLPVLAMLLTSVRTMDDIMRGRYWNWPEETAAVANYAAVLRDTPLPRYMLNSVVVSGLVVVGALALATMAGFALARYRFPGNALLFGVFVAGNFVPVQILMIPVRDLTLRLGLYDTTMGLVLFHVAYQSGFCTLFMRNFIRQLPSELFEAARVDGVRAWQVFLFVVLPLVRPALAALAVLVFTFVWNDYFWALVLTQTDAAKPVTVGLQALQGEWIAAWNLISAGSVVAALPPALMFFAMQRHLVAGLTLGGVKG